MPEPIRLIQLGFAPYWQTQTVFHALAEAMTDESSDAIIICRPSSPYLSLGFHQSFDAVLDRAECARRQLPVMRRQVGGGATYLDANQIFYQCVFHRSRVPPVSAAIFARLLEAPVATLRRLGLNAQLHEVNEIEVDEKRIAGTGGGQIEEACVVVGNLLFDFDYETMAQVWRVPSEAFRDLAREALRANITTLRAQLGEIAIPTVERILIEEYARALGRPLKLDQLTPAECEQMRNIREKLESEEFLNLQSTASPKSLKISARVSIDYV
ncbi:MAG: lipoate--protein ligase family protein [Chloroflexi bacterium]|nr:lipoate--protein ligase family protein [Chloroflexota bacterium]